MTKNRSTDINNDDLIRLKETLKWKTAINMGLGARVLKHGWANLTAEETGKIGGIVSKEMKKLSNKKPTDKLTKQ